ncbi:hypothetical protein [Sporosarcina sp. Te-1]|uniref:hypothetical protein n=1 Tax=Sporosarcina sp. Te-1 TaxID=2818390 RepID=UPI001A9F69A2|nr:hypothetical protein [Sporosarcina sp. Te-1]QTD39539.1 hypothetical protein J3U78_11745 [Sporosarcina sp. Te-1]
MDLLTSKHSQLSMQNNFTFNKPLVKTDIAAPGKSGDIDVKVETKKNVDVETKGTVDVGKGASVADDIFKQGKKVVDKFNIDDAYVKPKHLSTTKGNGAKFLGDSKGAAEQILKDSMKNGTVQSITDNGLTKMGKQSYSVIIDAGKPIGTKGENLIKVVLSEDGGMLSAYPIK